MEDDTFACRGKIDNCRFGGNDECYSCLEGFARDVRYGKCAPTDMQIKDCYSYSNYMGGEVYCGLCKNGKISGDDSKICDLDHPDKNCEYDSDTKYSISCKQCKEGWAKNNNLNDKYCDIPVSGDLIGCQTLNDNRDECTSCKIYPGKNGEQY